MRKTNRQIKAIWENMISDQKWFSEPKINCWECHNCRHIIKSVRHVSGATPMVMNCTNCDGRALSSYGKDLALDQPASIEWYRPTYEKLMKLFRKQNKQTAEHVLSGGLLARPHAASNSGGVVIDSKKNRNEVA